VSIAGASAAKADPTLHALYEFADLVVSSASSPRQRQRLQQVTRTPLAGAGMTALRVVERHGPIAVSDVARRLEVDQSTASRHVRALEDMGLVTRTADADDRRVGWLEITAKGRQLRERLREVSLNDFDVALAGWSPADRAKLAKLLDRLRIALLDARVDESGWAVDKASAGKGRQ
jgi:DNA-binding MarR family transcriptional regulator